LTDVSFLNYLIMLLSFTIQIYLAGLIKEPYGYTYVNIGIGTFVFPFRIAAPPEITCFTLQKYGAEKNDSEKENTIFN
jgi:predicted MPP superfamily phosphohydrolase